MSMLTFRAVQRSQTEDRFIATIYRQAVRDSRLPRLLLANDEILQFLQQGMLQSVTAEVDGERAACLFIRRDQQRADHGIISFIGVDGAQRRCGIGEATLRHGALLLREAGCKTASLASFTANKAANAFYKNCGWACATPARNAAELTWFKALPPQPVRHDHVPMRKLALILEGSAG